MVHGVGKKCAKKVKNPHLRNMFDPKAEYTRYKESQNKQMKALRALARLIKDNARNIARLSHYNNRSLVPMPRHPNNRNRH